MCIYGQGATSYNSRLKYFSTISLLNFSGLQRRNDFPEADHPITFGSSVLRYVKQPSNVGGYLPAATVAEALFNRQRQLHRTRPRSTSRCRSGLRRRGRSAARLDRSFRDVLGFGVRAQIYWHQGNVFGCQVESGRCGATNWLNTKSAWYSPSSS